MTIRVRAWQRYGVRGWRWECSDHPRHRGFHHSQNFEDQRRMYHGEPPRKEPRLRALDAAQRHYLLYHDPSVPWAHLWRRPKD